MIEGPPEADALAPLAADPGLRPPVALLAHLVDEPARSAFWPFAAFSPEWTALRWAAAYEVPVRFIDLPAANSLAMRDEEEREPADGEGDGDGQEVREDDTPAQDAGRPGDAGSGDAGSGDAGSGDAGSGGRGSGRRGRRRGPGGRADRSRRRTRGDGRVRRPGALVGGRRRAPERPGGGGRGG
ncbi:DUF5682 family protein [Streptomyces sp. SPB78]|uniref:DUF5682 family protein n=1 Tax=Streptomyces sp. (strain SPB78) TaxID=591157 RepID=UPI003B641BA7